MSEQFSRKISSLDFVNDVTTPKERRRKKSSDSFPLLYFSLDNFFLESFPDRKDQQWHMRLHSTSGITR